MTKKDYELFANEINLLYRQGAHVDNTVETCKRVFRMDNSLFQPDKFHRACYEGKHIRKSIREGV